MRKEFCKCGHSKKSHLITSDINMCCCVWQVSEEKEAIENRGSLLRFCECKGFEPELKPKSDVSSKGEGK